MDHEGKVKKVLFVNKFGPASNAITGQTAKELADFLHVARCEVSFLCIGSGYRTSRKENTSPVDYKVRYLRDYYNGDSSFLRLMMSFIDGFRFFIHSMRIKHDVMIIMTDPPLLFFWYQLFRGLYKSKLVYWTMDLYPDAFAAGGFVSPKNIFYRFFKHIVYRKPPDLLIALGEGQRGYLESAFQSPIHSVVIPCGVVKSNHRPADEVVEKDKIIFGYGGNIGAAHDANFLIELIQQLNPEAHRIVLSLYGLKSASVKEAITGHPAVEFREFLNHQDISSFDINIASLLPEWNHVCVPSKAVTTICCGSSLLYNAPVSADGWTMFREACWLIEPDGNYKTAIKDFLQRLNKEEIIQKRIKAREMAAECIRKKEISYQQVLQFIQNK